MQRTSLVLLVALLSVFPVFAADIFPLTPGSTWEYRAEGRAETLVIRVAGSQLYAGGRTYSRLIGYVNRPLWVRLGDDGDLYYLDEESSQDRLLTMFAVQSFAWFEAPFRPCEQEGQAHSDHVPYSGPTGGINNTLAVRYRSYSCADIGVEAEQFAANIGMVRRIVSTITGVVTYNLVYADTGAVQLAPRGGVTLRLAIESEEAASTATAHLRLTSDPDTAPTLLFPTSQQFDVELRNASGATVWRWSDGRFFLPSRHELQGDNLAYDVEIPLDQFSLPGGDYSVEAWLTTEDTDRAPRVHANLRLQPPSEQRSLLRATRARQERKQQP